MRIENLAQQDVVGPDSGRTMFQNVSWKAYNRTGSPVIAGRCYMFDTSLQTTVETAVNSEGKLLPAVTDYSRGDTGAYGNIVTPANVANQTKAKFGQFCMARTSAPDNELVDVLVLGEIAARCSFAIASTSYPAGTTLVPAFFNGGAGYSGNESANLQVIGGQANNLKPVGITLQATVSVGSQDPQNGIQIYFNGINSPFA